MTNGAYVVWIAVLAYVVVPLYGARGQALDEPYLPPGLGAATPSRPGETAEPTLPEGLERVTAPQEPVLPEGLGEEPAGRRADEDGSSSPRRPLDLFGFLDARVGVRTQEDPYEKDVSIGEIRLRMHIAKAWEWATVTVTSDFLYDPVLDCYTIRLEEGQGWIDVREAHLLLRPVTFMDVKVGRQIFDLGTGDLLFINDLFPKDFHSFLIGRDSEYLKAPSDALKASLFSPVFNLDVVYTPRFDADRFIDGRRLSFFNHQVGRRSGRDMVVRVDKPAVWFKDDEVAWRLYTNVRGYELALYGYRGFWKSPAGVDPAVGTVTFPPLSVYGASARGVIGKGIGNLELGYYDSQEDRHGDNPFVRNSEFRVLVGYEQAVARDFTVGLQYLLEHMLHYSAFRRTLPPESPRPGATRHLLTLRLTKLLLRQTLQLSLFTFYSPSDVDAYLRPNIHYKLNDFWSVEIGGNVFVGADESTFFGQFANNSNVYVGVRYSF